MKINGKEAGDGPFLEMFAALPEAVNYGNIIACCSNILKCETTFRSIWIKWPIMTEYHSGQ